MPPKTKAKSNAKSPVSAKKSSSAKLQFAKVDLGDLVSQQISTEQSGSSMKRKASQVTEGRSSPVESSQGSPSKKKRSSLPAPGSEDYNLLSPVSITAMVDTIVSGSTTESGLTFGTAIGSSERPKRKMAKTEKVKLNEVQPYNPSLDTVSDYAPSKSADVIAEGHDVITASPSVQALADLSDGEHITPVSSPQYTPKNRVHLPPASNASCVDSDGEQASDDLNRETGYVDQIDDSRGVESQVKVMLSPCPDPHLAPLYSNLPPLPRLCEVKTFSGKFVDSLRTNFAERCAGLHQEEIQCVDSSLLSICPVALSLVCRGIIRALAFTKNGYYVNTARVNPSDLFVENNRLRVRDPRNLAVGIMTGTATESYLVDTTQAGPRNNPYAIHKLTLAPFQQEWRRDVSLWGLLFKFYIISGSVSEHGFSFTTRGEGKGDGWRTASVPSSPVKGVKSVSSPLSGLSQDGSYPNSRSFNDIIPVYDGRARNGRPGFGFSDADFQKLSSWPLYRKPPCEVPTGAVVSVGYTVSTYTGTTEPVLSSNIQFVILLAAP